MKYRSNLSAATCQHPLDLPLGVPSGTALVFCENAVSKVTDTEPDKSGLSGLSRHFKHDKTLII